MHTWRAGSCRWIQNHLQPPGDTLAKSMHNPLAKQSHGPLTSAYARKAVCLERCFCMSVALK